MSLAFPNSYKPVRNDFNLQNTDILLLYCFLWVSFSHLCPLNLRILLITGLYIVIYLIIIIR